MHGDPNNPDPFAGIPKPGDPMPPTDEASLTFYLDHGRDPTPEERRRMELYDLEHRRAANSELLRGVDREVFLEELGAPSLELLGAVVRAFACAALRLPAARTRDGWQKVMVLLRFMLGTAVRCGLTEVRPIPNATVPPRIPQVPPIPAWEIAAYERRRLDPAEIEANLAYWKGLPVRLVETLVRAHVSARCCSPDGATPEGRSRILGAVRGLVLDALVDAAIRYPCPPPSPQSPPKGRGPAQKRPPVR